MNFLLIFSVRNVEFTSIPVPQPEADDLYAYLKELENDYTQVSTVWMTPASNECSYCTFTTTNAGWFADHLATNHQAEQAAQNAAELTRNIELEPAMIIGTPIMHPITLEKKSDTTLINVVLMESHGWFRMHLVNGDQITNWIVTVGRRWPNRKEVFDFLREKGYTVRVIEPERKYTS